MTDIKIRIGKRIKELRNSIGISQEQLGFKAELDRTYITGVESGKRNISIVALEKIILALDTNYTQFFNNETFK
jgi:transcriptional regulator with XRE-family HTH domain